MIIDIKFEIGDKVYFLYENRVIASKIRKIITETRLGEKYIQNLINHIIEKEVETSVQYEVGDVDRVVISENNLFSTKEELLKSL